MVLKPFLGALAAIALLSACSSPPPPRPVAQAPAVPVTPPPAAPTGDGRVAAIRFDANSNVLTPMARAELGPVLDRLMANPNTPVRITSYSTREAMPLSRERTQAIRAALTDRGVSSSRIRVLNARPMANSDPDVVQVEVRGPASRAQTPRA
ncbi:CpaD family pilus assembly lipoprotein [Roseococcus pinisoli]|uniref:OmpA family protein n=1 Tax=Roseococcus pinisoli TaxID=2835040 RepID=A0ABS5QHH5_9PROT|nr:CpaD family pilus assembly lipoprotein [Roseococcus pinisoli]MBS7813054.1 OmpA family protein [Roseococcus pinisoli]